METVLLLSIVTLFVGMLQVLFGPMMLSLYDPGTLGTVQALSASGMLIGGILIGLLGLPQRLDILIALSLGGAGIFLGMMGFSTGLVWISLSFFLFFFCLPFINTGAEVLIRTSVPRQFSGTCLGTDRSDNPERLHCRLHRLRTPGGPSLYPSSVGPWGSGFDPWTSDRYRAGKRYRP